MQQARASESHVGRSGQEYLAPQRRPAPIVRVRGAHASDSSSSSPDSPDLATSSEFSIILGHLDLLLSVAGLPTARPTGDGRFAGDATAAGLLRPASRIQQPVDPIVEQLSQALEAAECSQDDFACLYADSLRLALVARLLVLQSDPAYRGNQRSAQPQNTLPMWRLKRTAEYIEANLGETITLSDMAAVTGLSRMHFAAQFRAATGIRPHEFLLRRRIERAKEMLAKTQTPLVEIALSIGFQTQSHFSVVFKRFVGETPNRWRSINSGVTRERTSGHGMLATSHT
ncbi:AraC family transcriptional regulator [Mesorhizobium sp. SARCC-RB16n]|uniref:AraC family transcriptional regulator n=1 Tax=Mesorhizobium sp. SARCC-RB16n TaxID=2116687 RepID=UPI00122EBEE6|nr:AraC family transcriptional regulator [Mesorhizobium sp. SARCC-RB16n]KAA3451592.1 AraC family transcriptional regulator [Mesorhizobium sp. SARCC-RB16n]